MLRVRTVFTVPPGTPWLSTMYFNGASQALADAAVVDVGTFWGSVDALMNTAVSWATDADVAQLDEETGDLETSYATTPQTGSGASAGDLLPLVAQALVRWRTAGVVNGRHVRGRSFVPGVTEAFASGGRPIAGALTTMTTAAGILVSSANSELAIWSRPFDGDPTADPPIDPRVGTTHTVTSGSPWSEFASMRSRRD
jgi:hypothetical protein